MQDDLDTTDVKNDDNNNVDNDGAAAATGETGESHARLVNNDTIICELIEEVSCPAVGVVAAVVLLWISDSTTNNN